MSRLRDIMDKLTSGDRRRISTYQHPHNQRLKYYRYRTGITRSLTNEDMRWLNANTTAPYSMDNTIAPYNLSFVNRTDAVLFKLTFGASWTCAPWSN